MARDPNVNGGRFLTKNGTSVNGKPAPVVSQFASEDHEAVEEAPSHGAGISRFSPAAGGEDGDDGPEILLGIHPDGRLLGLENPDGDAGLQQAELLELFRLLEG